MSSVLSILVMIIGQQIGEQQQLEGAALNLLKQQWSAVVDRLVTMGLLSLMIQLPQLIYTQNGNILLRLKIVLLTLLSEQRYGCMVHVFLMMEMMKLKGVWS